MPAQDRVQRSSLRVLGWADHARSSRRSAGEGLLDASTVGSCVGAPQLVQNFGLSVKAVPHDLQNIHG